MSICTLSFSPTGGTDKVLHILASEFGPAHNIDLTARQDFSGISFAPEDICIFGVPAFAGRIPAIATERICQLTGNGAKAVIVAVFGNRAIDDTLIELKDAVESRGFTVAGGISAVAEHSIMRAFGTGRPDKQDEEELWEFARQILAHIHTAREIPIPGNRPYKAAGGKNMIPVLSETCTGCGTCADRCPAGAISPANFSIDEEVCISCMRCIAVCPVKARGLDPEKLAAKVQMLQNALGGRKQNELFL